ncbi:unnamed protein product [Protopolystoma xenopodis]|uniref:Uncharacterized protein n=1 Tax=Protopolystoma xenopodis TaxID=117903 RepID=A0A3S5CGQ4_9PLAT|nr:unnamed protein product [Protopolystoma xenopodis]
MSGIQWRNEAPRSLVDLIEEFRATPSSGNPSDNRGTTHLLRAICQRPGCRCALRGHDSLMVFTVFDASFAYATWERILTGPGATLGASGPPLLALPTNSKTTKQLACSVATSLGGSVAAGLGGTEIQARMMVFRQCRGWYEVLNESHQSIPHWTTLEQLHRARPSTFLLRKELRCLLSPASLSLVACTSSPIGQGGRHAQPSTGQQHQQLQSVPHLPISSAALIAQATSPETLAASQPHILPTGSLLHYIDYLPNCSFRRGKHSKNVNLVLAMERQSTSSRMKEPTDLAASDPASGGQPRRQLPQVVYIGTEESAVTGVSAVLPPRLACSPVAGPENISGVHSMASILRKFRLPISVRPVAVPESKTATTTSPAPLTAPTGGTLTAVTGQVPAELTRFPLMNGLVYTDRHLLRLRSIYRGDLLIIAPTSSPERFFLITPAMLQDHLFQVGTSVDPVHQRLCAGHRSRTANFLATAHPRDSLSYLLRYMQEITHQPRPPPGVKSVGNQNAKPIDETGGEHESAKMWPPLQIPLEEAEQIYEELDDIYYFIRNGYYPPTSRARRASTLHPPAVAGSNAQPAALQPGLPTVAVALHQAGQQPSGPVGLVRPALGPGPGAVAVSGTAAVTSGGTVKWPQSQRLNHVPTAEELLAASLGQDATSLGTTAWANANTGTYNL